MKDVFLRHPRNSFFMLQNQKHLFDLPIDEIYLNGAYMSPQLKKVTQVGIENLKRKSNPISITETDFFSGKKFSKNNSQLLLVLTILMI